MNASSDAGSRAGGRILVARPIPVQLGARRLLTAVRSSNTGLLALALIVGAGAGGGAIVFRWLIKTFTLALSGHADYSAAGHAANPHLPWLGRWFVIFAPVAAGLLYGPLVHFFAREARATANITSGTPCPPRWTDRTPGRGGQGTGLRVVYRWRRVGRARGPDRADRLGARLDTRPAHAGRGVPDADPRGVWGSRWYRRDVQCAVGRGVLRDGADPARLHR